MKTKSLTIAADFFLPRFCLNCESKLNQQRKIVCEDCLNEAQKPDKLMIQSEYSKKFLNEKLVKDFISLYLFEHDGVTHTLIHELKYNKKFRVGIFLGQLLSEELIKTGWQIDVIVPMPLHRLKKAERGYNQSFYIAKGVSKKLGYVVSSSVVKRLKYTQSQTKLNSDERRVNISGAFKINSVKKIKGKNLLLIDDVITTGASISELARVLKKSGANKIYAASVAIAN